MTTNYPIQQWQLEMIERTFKVWYGLKQLVIDGREEGITMLSARTNLNRKLIERNLEKIKAL